MFTNGFNRAGFKCSFLLLALALTGCNSSLSGAPEKLFSADQELKELRENYGSTLVRRYHTADDNQRKNIRNSIVLGRMYAADVAYGEYEKALTTERQKIPFLATTTSLALSGTGAVIADSASKSILAAIDTGLKGTKESYDKEILLEKTIELMQQNMRSNRNLVRASIIPRLSLPDSEYPLELALSDVERYRVAGTLSSGTISASGAASDLLVQTEEFREEQSTIPSTFGSDDHSALLRTYWRKVGTVAMRSEMSKIGIQDNVSSFLAKQHYAADRRKLVQKLGLK